MISNLHQLNNLLFETKTQNKMYFGIIIENTSDNKAQYELIINHVDNLKEKLKYYNTAYYNNLKLKTNENIRIKDCIIFNDYRDLELYY